MECSVRRLAGTFSGLFPWVTSVVRVNGVNLPALPGGAFWHVFVKGISFNLDDIQNCKQVKGIGKLLTGDPLYAVLKRNMPISGGQANLIGRKKYPPLSL